jgi:hypothetical protein
VEIASAHAELAPIGKQKLQGASDRLAMRVESIGLAELCDDFVHSRSGRIKNEQRIDCFRITIRGGSAGCDLFGEFARPNPLAIVTG